jgi:hypothetical protein
VGSEASKLWVTILEPTRLVDGHLQFRQQLKIHVEVEHLGSNWEVVLVYPESDVALGNNIFSAEQHTAPHARRPRPLVLDSDATLTPSPCHLVPKGFSFVLTTLQPASLEWLHSRSRTVTEGRPLVNGLDVVPNHWCTSSP